MVAHVESKHEIRDDEPDTEESGARGRERVLQELLHHTDCNAAPSRSGERRRAGVIASA